jgi:hypothetical protein
MFRWSAVVARQREVKRVFVDMFVFPTILRTVAGATVGEATVAWRPTIARRGFLLGQSGVI